MNWTSITLPKISLEYACDILMILLPDMAGSKLGLETNFSQSSWDQLLSPVSSLLPARQAGVTQMVFSCQCRSSWALTSWHGPKSICRAACIRWERNAYFLLFRKWHAKYRYQEIPFPTLQHFLCCSFKQLMMYGNPDIWPPTKPRSTMTLLLFDASPAFGKLVLQPLLLDPRQGAKVHEEQKETHCVPPHYWNVSDSSAAKPSQSLNFFLQEASGPTWELNRGDRPLPGIHLRKCHQLEKQ